MRLSPLPADQWDDDARRAVASLLPEDRRNPRDAGNLLSTLVRHPELTRAFLKFNGASSSSRSVRLCRNLASATWNTRNCTSVPGCGTRKC